MAQLHVSVTPFIENVRPVARPPQLPPEKLAVVVSRHIAAAVNEVLDVAPNAVAPVQIPEHGEVATTATGTKVIFEMVTFRFDGPPTEATLKLRREIVC